MSVLPWLFGAGEDVAEDPKIAAQIERDRQRNHATTVASMEREHTGIRARLSQAERREADLTDALRHARDQRERVDLTGHLAELNVQTMTLRARVGHISTALDQLKKEKP